MQSNTMQSDWTGSPAPDAEESDATEFEQAVNLYKERSGRAFPTWCEILEVLKGLGYTKAANPGRFGYNVQIDRSGGDVWKIELFLTRLGGVPAGSRSGARLIAFPSEAARAEALEAVRAKHGWTSVESSD
ncbi:hypothetical protein [Paludisphaera rhizosphaerae]|uniref:hypothetical protein n=1 Tax=Paludisphaera rhizosphaerae TaxID=2711216 RepID=UPI0013EAC318|nr:hypothetical protein [Paludisphaera rhizosphaerae]